MRSLHNEENILMAKFLVDLWLDGYDTEEEMVAACEEFIQEQLDTTASSVHVQRYVEQENKC